MITVTHTRSRLLSLLVAGTTIIASAATAQQRWEQIDGPEGGEVTAFGQLGETILTAAMDQGGVTGIFRSITGGASWLHADELTTSEMEVNSFATVGDTLYAGTPGGLYRSLDGGHTWDRIPFQRFLPTALRVAALDGTVLAAGIDSAYTITPTGALKALAKPWPDYTVVHAVALSDGAMFIGAAAAFVRSTDRGATWEAITLDPNAGPVISLAATGDTILALTFGTGAYRSIDNGAHWEKVAATDLTVGSISIMGATAYLCDPYRHLIERSSDAGATWVSLRNGPAIGAIHITPDALFAATLDQSGVLRSLDDGVTWRAMNKGLFKEAGQTLLPMGQDLLIGTTAGLFRLSGTNDSIHRLTEPDEIRLLARLDDDIIYAGEYGFARWSARSGRWFHEKIESDTDRVTTLAAVGDALYIATRGTIYRATNTGTAFTYERTGIDSVKIRSIASAGNAIIVTDGASIWRTTDAGGSWERQYGPQASPFPFGTYIYRVTYLGGAFHALTSGGIYRSADGNLPWSRLSTDLDRRSVYALADADGILYAATDSLMYRSLDNGSRWSTFNDGLYAGTVLRLALVGKTLYAAPYYYPIHRIQAGTLSAPDEGEMADMHLELRPNPAAGATTIAYTIARRGRASMALFDLMGRELRTLLDEEIEAGEHELRLDATGLPSGVYYVSLEAGGSVVARAVEIEGGK